MSTYFFVVRNIICQEFDLNDPKDLMNSSYNKSWGQDKQIEQDSGSK